MGLGSIVSSRSGVWDEHHAEIKFDALGNDCNNFLDNLLLNHAIYWLILDFHPSPLKFL